MSSLVRSTNIAMASLLLIEAVVAVILDKTDESGLGVTMVVCLLMFPTLIAWPIILLIDRRAARQPAKVLTEDELKQFKIKRALVIVGLIAMIIFAVRS